MLRSPAIPYIAPFAAFMGYLALRSAVTLPALFEQVLCLVVMSAVLWWFSRSVLSFRCVAPLSSVILGIAVFFLWIGPEWLIPGYRQHWLFSNSILGSPVAGIAEADRGNTLVLVLRSVRAAILVPMLEELFWRAWMLRWIINPDFERVPLGAWSLRAFWIVAALFALEHGPYWEVGLLTGMIYNAWMVRTRSLGDLILTHGVTNACLSAYVVASGQWHYW